MASEWRIKSTFTGIRIYWLADTKDQRCNNAQYCQPVEFHVLPVY